MKEKLIKFVANVISLAIASWTTMLLLGAFWGLHYSYIKTLSGLYIIGTFALMVRLTLRANE